MAKAVDSFYNVSVEYSILHLDPGAVADGRRAIPLDYKDYYETLKVKKDASQDEIQKAYRKLARKFHPDVNKAPDSERRFKEIGEAYEVLKDPEKRKKYDQFGAAWKQSGGVPPEWQGFDFGGVGGGGRPGGGGGFDFQDLGGGEGFSSFFEMLFGNAGARGGGRGAVGGGGRFDRPGRGRGGGVKLDLGGALRERRSQGGAAVAVRRLRHGG